MKRKIFSLVFIAAIALIGCYPDDSLEVPITPPPTSEDPLDIYIQENFIDTYGIAVRFKYVDRYVEGDKRVVPPKREVVEPMLDFLTDFWIEPFVDVENGEAFFKRYVPAEIVFIGSPIYNNDGTVTLGTADAGARITLTEVNDIDLDNDDWVFQQLHTIYHEFAHIVHQNFNLPAGWKQISPGGYTSPGSWYNLTDDEALKRGFVSNYATSSFNEDFAETAAFILFDPDFYDNYIDDDPNCTTSDCDDRNEGRALIRKKYNDVLTHYEQYTGVDLLEVREIIQDKLN
jgi:substrate import-associated zinc metallohydrolase lipoprotein